MSPDSDPAAGARRATRPRTAGTFDIRNIIGALLGLFGLVLIAAYFFLDPGINPDVEDSAKLASDNLWVGLGMIAAAVVFLLWARFRPIIVEDAPADDAKGE